MSKTMIWIICAVLAVVVLVVVILVVRYQRFRSAVTKHGWSYDGSPELGDYLDLQLPPFGMGIERRVEDAITGVTPSGRPFACVEYRYGGAGRNYRSRLLSVALPAPGPVMFVSERGPRQGLSLGDVPLYGAEGDGLSALASTPELAAAGLTAAAALRGGDGDQLIDFSLDGARVVFEGASKTPAELAAMIERVAATVDALASLPLTAPVEPPLRGYHFYGHRDWALVGSDLGVLPRYPTATGGFGHETSNLIRGDRDGIAMDAFEHTWKTTETRMVSDGKGGSRLETYTENHSEVVLGFTLPFSLPSISVNGRRLGERVRFESTAFNDAFKVRAENAKFASDVIHPRTMEWLLAQPPVAGWTIWGSVVEFEVSSLDMFVLDACEEQLRGFLGRIPRFVWNDLGIPVPPFLVE